MHKTQDSGSHASLDVTAMLNDLTNSRAFSFALPDEQAITLIQTHASMVVLTPDRVYKLKKSQDFGFFDYSTPTLRRHFCQQEVLLNMSLAPGVYLGVAPVLRGRNGRFRFGPVLPPDDALPLPEALFDEAIVIDYAVVMVRLPDSATLEAQVQADTADARHITEIARFLAAFHSTTTTNEQIAHFGGLDVIRENWEENFAQMMPYIGRTLDSGSYERIATYIRHFLALRVALFASRIREGHIRDCHGDVRLQHIYMLDQIDAPGQPMPRIALLDRIEFNERFRYSDVASEVAFLTMELEAAGRSDLSRGFIDAYIGATGDETLRELLPFYQCYRACVRGKVLSFQLDEPEIPEEQREEARQQAIALFSLAAHYANGSATPLLVMVGGLMGTGKSTIALGLQHESGWALFSSDMVRKQLTQLDPSQPQTDAFGQGIYRPEWTTRTYNALRMEAGKALAAGRSVLLDASFLRRADRQMMADEATISGAAVLFVECVCPRATALERLASRWKQRAAGVHLSAASIASDGRPDLYEAQRAGWEAFAAGEERATKHVVVTTTRPQPVSVEQVLALSGIARLACWFA